MIFSDLYDRLERARWNMSEIPFDRIDQAKIDDEIIHDVRHVALTELAAVSASKMFMRDFKEQMDFQRFLSVWSFEEAKHSLVLERWLNHLGVELTPQELSSVNIDFETAPWIETLTMHYLGEQRLGTWYAAFSGIGTGAKDSDNVVREPVLRQILKLMAEDEWRHAGCYFAFLKEAVRQNPDYMLNIGRMTLWMLRGKYRHPTNITTPSITDQLEDPQYFVHMIDRFLTPAAEKALEKRVLNAFSILAGQSVPGVKDLAHFLRNSYGKLAVA
ncbi:MAG TPA: acyl-ACP desaturase [Chloroflexia bacterium]|nr:acyl-ACP desaturase [Chloroflexia bacterium]